MAKTSFNLDSQADAQVFPFGTTSASGEALVTLYKGTAAASTVVLDVKGSQNLGGDLNVTGNLNITGTINETSVTNLNVTDINITLNNGGTTAGADGAGILIEGTSDAVIGAIKFDNTLASKFSVGDGTTQLEIVDVSSVQTLTNKVIGGGQISGNIGGNAANVTGIVLVANGGTGAATLTGYVKASGTSNMTASATIPGADISGNIPGNAANVTGTIAIANGGTGQTTAVAAYDALSPNTTLGDVAYRGTTNNVRLAGNTTAAKQFLAQTGNGTISAAPVWAAIAAGDVPTLNQNTTGTAANVTGIVLVANGGTGLATLTANNVILGNGTSTPLFVAPGTTGNVLVSNGTTWTSAAPAASGAYGRATTVAGTQDSANKVFTIGNALSADSEIISKNGQLLTPGASNDYVLSGTTLTFQAAHPAPKATDVLRAYGQY